MPQERPSRTVEVIADTVGDTVTPAATTALAAAARTTSAMSSGLVALDLNQPVVRKRRDLEG